MVTEFDTLKDVDKIIEHLKKHEYSAALIIAERLQVRTKSMCDDFDAWADAQSKIDMGMDHGQSDADFGLDPWETTDLAKSVKN